MDAFESMVGEILWRQGYWIQPSFKVELTKEEKVAIGRATTPRWEIDLVAYSGRHNELVAVECKSYLDSKGVAFPAFSDPASRFASRFKLFNDEKLRTVILGRLCRQLYETGWIAADPRVKLALACGKIASERDRDQIRRHFDDKGWLLWDDFWLKKRLAELAFSGYENSPVTLVTKLLLRHK